MATVVVVIALVGHALLMADGGHPTQAAPVSGAPHTHGGHNAHADRPAAPASTAAGATIDHGSPASDNSPAGDPAAACGDMLALARPQPTTASDVDTESNLSMALAPLVGPPDDGLVPTSDHSRPRVPAGKLRSLLQVYRL